MEVRGKEKEGSGGKGMKVRKKKEE